MRLRSLIDGIGVRVVSTCLIRKTKLLKDNGDLDAIGSLRSVEVNV